MSWRRYVLGSLRQEKHVLFLAGEDETDHLESVNFLAEQVEWRSERDV